MMTSAPGQQRFEADQTQKRRARVALICDFLEEGWLSMDLFGDRLFESYTSHHASVIDAEQLRPALRRRFSRIPGCGRAGVLWNTDRLLNRFYDYPAWLRKRASKFDLFHLMDHSYGQLVSELPAGRAVVTCHDLDTFRCILEPELDPRPRWFRAMAQRSLGGFLQAAHVICVSQFTRADILRHKLFPSDRITVISPGADPVFFADAQPSAEREAIELLGLEGENWLLHVGSTIPRKRIDVLLQLFAQLVKAVPQLKLVRVGGVLTTEQAQMANRLGIEDKIIQAPRLTKSQLAALYHSAVLVLQPSAAEGFGLPVIESMACGCPVVASDIAPLREAGGSAAEYCPVGDIQVWSETVLRLLSECETSPEAWKVRRDQCRQHARRHTWTENANQTMFIYRRILENGRELAVCKEPRLPV